METYYHTFPIGPTDGFLYPSEYTSGETQYRYDSSLGTWMRVPEVPQVSRLSATVIREGTLDRNRLPSSGVQSGTYTGITSISVNDKGQITNIITGS